jgi:hypothetical protein
MSLTRIILPISGDFVKRLSTNTWAYLCTHILLAKFGAKDRESTWDILRRITESVEIRQNNEAFTCRAQYVHCFAEILNRCLPPSSLSSTTGTEASDAPTPTSSPSSHPDSKSTPFWRHLKIQTPGKMGDFCPTRIVTQIRTWIDQILKESCGH